MRGQDFNLRPSGYEPDRPLWSTPVIRDFPALASLKCVGGPDTSASSQPFELAAPPPNTRAMAKPMRSAAASISLSPTCA